MCVITAVHGNTRTFFMLLLQVPLPDHIRLRRLNGNAQPGALGSGRRRDGLTDQSVKAGL
jgi:hypothetical protein